MVANSARTIGTRYTSLVLPARLSTRLPLRVTPRTCIVIPTYAPSAITRRLIEDCLSFNPNALVWVVDDSTPHTKESAQLFIELLAYADRLKILRTPRNTLKAGALNFALRHIEKERDFVPEAIVTIDDDVVITPSTISGVVDELISHRELGAVCSECRVYNKNKNLLTRLQGLEYVGFNAIRRADEGFLRGPLVMHGMLTAFRAEALSDVGGFAEEHLIEDYEITTRIKAKGWCVKSANDAPAWTVVPETMRQLWHQRTRWSYGGVTVVAAARNHPSAVFQDLFGHGLFIATLGLIAVLSLFDGASSIPRALINIIVVLSLAQLAAWYFFQLFLMRTYAERDAMDWMIRVSLIPELVYGYVMTLALLGSYCFTLFNICACAARRLAGRSADAFVVGGNTIFRSMGYTEKRWTSRMILP